MEEVVSLSEGAGGREMNVLVSEIRKLLGEIGSWKNSDSDSATLNESSGNLVFTTDSYVVSPLFFEGGNIGDLAFCGTVNDLVVKGALPKGISLGLIIEEGFSKKELFEIIETIGRLSKKFEIPVVTGDTKVMEKGAVDKLIINTSGVGFCDKPLDDRVLLGDQIIVSGSLGDHGTALLAKRFEIETNIKTDSKALVGELNDVKNLIRQARDITRGGIASVLNELSEKNKRQFNIVEGNIPLKKETKSITNILGIDPYSLACEGRFVCFCSKENTNEVLKKLREHNSQAAIIGEVVDGSGVVIQTSFGKRILNMPAGSIVPRIC